MQNFKVRKADGEVEPFSEEKLRRSLTRAGAGEGITNEIVQKIKETFQDKTPKTSEIYKKAFSILRKKEEPRTAARYSLKRAVFDLGPSGFPFEYFLSELFTSLGYKTHTGVIMEGGCATHEVDVVAEREDEVLVVEAKFHNNLGLKTDMKVLLYVSARFDDLKKNNFSGRKKNNMEGRGVVVTNTDFTTNSLNFSKCVGIRALSWNHPEKGNLHDLIENSGLHPVTCLTTLSKSQKRSLLDKGLVLCRMIGKDREKLERIGLSSEKIDKVLKEVKILCSNRAKSK